ncbi:unnamed protein product [Meganyctiphanes norvegica]|uniref:Uncharacterized protein n=1 Tax=Meganyctiphanes norvegica TaxID=48144 RepID=A0AAV2R9S6_MEGNR
MAAAPGPDAAVAAAQPAATAPVTTAGAAQAQASLAQDTAMVPHKPGGDSTGAGQAGYNIQSMDWLFKKERIFLLAQFWQQVSAAFCAITLLSPVNQFLQAHVVLVANYQTKTKPGSCNKTNMNKDIPSLQLFQDLSRFNFYMIFNQIIGIRQHKLLFNIYWHNHQSHANVIIITLQIIISDKP